MLYVLRLYKDMKRVAWLIAVKSEKLFSLYYESELKQSYTVEKKEWVYKAVVQSVCVLYRADVALFHSGEDKKVNFLLETEQTAILFITFKELISSL